MSEFTIIRKIILNLDSMAPFYCRHSADIQQLLANGQQSGKVATMCACSAKTASQGATPTTLCPQKQLSTKPYNLSIGFCLQLSHLRYFVLRFFFFIRTLMSPCHSPGNGASTRSKLNGILVG